MTHKLVPLIVFMGASLALGAPAESPFTFPTTPPAPVPPAPTPGAVPLLKVGVWYVINSKVDATVDVYPEGLTKVTKEAGPVTIKGIFIDGTGQVETRKYPGPYVFYVEPATNAVGRVTVVVTPLGIALKSSADLGKSLIDINGQTVPVPPVPPDPPVPPNPAHVIPTWVIVVEETSQRTPTTAGVLNDLSMWKRIEAKGVKYRIYDKDSPDAKSKNYVTLSQPLQPNPATGKWTVSVLHLDSAGKLIKSYALPATSAELESTILTGAPK